MFSPFSNPIVPIIFSKSIFAPPRIHGTVYRSPLIYHTKISHACLQKSIRSQWINMGSTSPNMGSTSPMCFISPFRPFFVENSFPEIWDHHVITWFNLGALPKVESVLTHLGFLEIICAGVQTPIMWVNIPIIRIPYYKCRWPSPLKKRVDRPWHIWASSNGIHLVNLIGCWERQFFPEWNPQKGEAGPLVAPLPKLPFFGSLYMYALYIRIIRTSPPCIFLANTQLEALHTTFFSVPRHMNEILQSQDLGAIPIQSMFLWGFNLVFVWKLLHETPMIFYTSSIAQAARTKGSKVGFSVCVWLWNRWWVWA